MKGTSRSFWALVGLSLIAGGAVMVVSARAGATELGCWWAPLRTLAYRGGVCGESMWPLGYRSLVSALVLIALTGACVGSAAFAVARQGLRTHRAWAELANHQVPAPPAVIEAAAKAALVPPKVLRDDRAYCFCRALVRPEVVVSTAMIGALGPDELAAVFVHEGAHVARRDPLRAMVAHGAAAGLFFLPVMGDLAKPKLRALRP